MTKNEILNSDCDVRRNAAGNPNIPAEVLTELAKDSDWAVRRSAAGNPNTPVEVLTELAKDSYWAVRCSAAGNPNTPAEVLTELAKDSDWAVRRNAAGNPNTPGYKETTYDFVIAKNYVAVKGTNHMWYKHNYPQIAPFYTCGCFCGSREQLLIRIYSIDNMSCDPAIRIRILNALDNKFKEVFGR